MSVTYGATKIEMGDFNPATGETSNYVEVPVYRDTFSMTEPDPAITEHFQQGRSSPRVRTVSPAAIEIVFQLMDTDPTNLLAALGGTITTVTDVDTWNAPKSRSDRTKALKITVEDGSIIEVPAFLHYVKPNFQITEENINLIDVNGTIQDTGLPAVPDWTWTEPAA